MITSHDTSITTIYRPNSNDSINKKQKGSLWDRCISAVIPTKLFCRGSMLTLLSTAVGSIGGYFLGKLHDDSHPLDTYKISSTICFGLLACTGSIALNLICAPQSKKTLSSEENQTTARNANTTIVTDNTNQAYQSTWL